MVPRYSQMYFDSQAEFDDYIASPDYKSSTKFKGICFGVQHFADNSTEELEMGNN